MTHEAAMNRVSSVVALLDRARPWLNSGANVIDLAFRVLAGGSSYVDPRVAGRMLKQRYGVAGGGSTAGVGELTGREADILRLIAHGLSNKEIGGKLQLSEKTIKNHISRIFSKLNVQARTQAAVYAIKTGMA